MITQAEANVLRIEKEKLESQIQKMKLLSTTANFFKYYFAKLKEFDSNIACFNSVNQEYHDLLFGLL